MAIKTLAEQGNRDAQLLISLLQVGRDLRTHLEGAAAGLGLTGDKDDVLNSIREDMMADLLPVMLRMSLAGISPGSLFDSLQWHISIQKMIDVVVENYLSFHSDRIIRQPLTVVISEQWKRALDKATTHNTESGITVKIEYTRRKITSIAVKEAGQ
jgi:hypothetical protein